MWISVILGLHCRSLSAAAPDTRDSMRCDNAGKATDEVQAEKADHQQEVQVCTEVQAGMAKTPISVTVPKIPCAMRQVRRPRS